MGSGTAGEDVSFEMTAWVVLSHSSLVGAEVLEVADVVV